MPSGADDHARAQRVLDALLRHAERLAEEAAEQRIVGERRHERLHARPHVDVDHGRRRLLDDRRERVLRGLARGRHAPCAALPPEPRSRPPARTPPAQSRRCPPDRFAKPPSHHPFDRCRRCGRQYTATWPAIEGSGPVRRLPSTHLLVTAHATYSATYCATRHLRVASARGEPDVEHAPIHQAVRGLARGAAPRRHRPRRPARQAREDAERTRSRSCAPPTGAGPRRCWTSARSCRPRRRCWPSATSTWRTSAPGATSRAG